MMAAINHGRMTHDYDGELVVFLIGMKINKWWRPDLWLPVFRAMPPMIAELARDPDSGMIGYRLIFDPTGPWLVQYWNSLDKLYGYAGDRDKKHRPAWAAYNRMARRAAGAVGIWHETYPVQRAESIYVAMPPEGLGKATGVKPVTRDLTSARARIGARGGT
jgi:hypothetical protein